MDNIDNKNDFQALINYMFCENNIKLNLTNTTLMLVKFAQM